jgi:hypothetical protein
MPTTAVGYHRFVEQVLDSFSGTGKIYEGLAFVADCEYDVAIMQSVTMRQSMDSSGSAELPGLKRVIGRIRTSAHLPSGKEFELHPQVWRLRFLVSDAQGNIVGNGMPYEA